MAEVDNPSRFPDPSQILKIEEPIIDASVITREEYLGEILKLLEEKRGTQKKFEYIGSGRVLLLYEMPLNEIVLDFYDRLKSVSKGYASLDYEPDGELEADLVKVDILVNGDKVDALSQLVHREKARQRALHYCERLDDTIVCGGISDPGSHSLNTSLPLMRRRASALSRRRRAYRCDPTVPTDLADRSRGQLRQKLH